MTGGRRAVFDSIIVGGGPAGLSAGMYLARAGWRAGLIERGALGGQALKIEQIENYPGFPRGVSGRELMRRFAAQARRWNLSAIKAEATRVSKKRERFRIVTDRGPFEARSLILCSGARFRTLGLPGEGAILSRGLHHDAFDSADRFKGRCVAVVGGGDTAVHQALWLARKARLVYLVHRGGRLKAIPLLQRRLRSRPSIKRLFHAVVRRAWQERGAKTRFLAGIEVEDLKTHRTRRLPAAGLFVLIGKEPEDGLIRWRTAPSGFFAAGDALLGRFHQVGIAAGEGLRAAMECEQFLLSR